jgi:hypothetical protein
MPKTQEYIMHRFDDIGSFVKAAKRNARKGESSHRRDGRHGDNWHGSKTFDESVDYALRGGWEPSELLEFRHMFDNIEPRLRKFVDAQFERGIDQAGYEVNMQAFLDGEPDHMFQWVPAEHVVTKRALCVIIGHSISAGCTSEELFVRGQAAIALVRALMLLGYELEIWSEETVGGGFGFGGPHKGKLFSTLVRLHAAGSVLDESAVEFAVGNPSWLRRLLFGFQEGQPDDVRQAFGFGTGGYGSCQPIVHAELVGADVQLDLGQSWFGENWNRGERTAEEGMRWVVQQLKNLGVVDADAEWED